MTNIFRSRSRIRLAALAAAVCGLVAFVGAQGSGGRTAIVLIAVSLVLFLLEIAFGIADRPERSGEDRPL